MPRLDISSVDLSRIFRHAAQAYPEECCGILTGSRTEVVTTVRRVVATENSFEGSKLRGYRIPEAQLLSEHLAARDLGLEVVGYYHSHPDGESRPSRLDLDRAWPEVSYLIVPLEGKKAGTPRAWSLVPENESFVEEPVLIS